MTTKDDGTEATTGLTFGCLGALVTAAVSAIACGVAYDFGVQGASIALGAVSAGALLCAWVCVQALAKMGRAK